MSAWMRKRQALWLALALTAALAIALWPMPKRTFGAGDPGVRLLFIESLWEADGSSYFGVRYPAKELDPQQLLAPTYLFHRVGERILPVYPMLFTLLSALSYWLLGAIGLYLLPLLGGVGTGLLTYLLARPYAPRWAAAAGLLAVLGSSALVYSVEFWDHTTGVTLALVAIFLWISALERGRVKRLFFAGLCAGLAVAVRPEMYMLVPLLPAAAWWVWRPDWRRLLGRYALGVLPVLAALWLSNLLIYHHPLGGQIAVNLPPTIRNLIGWYIAVRRDVLALLLPLQVGWGWALLYVPGALFAGLAWLSPRVWRGGAPGRALSWATLGWLAVVGAWSVGNLRRGAVMYDLSRTFPLAFALLAAAILARVGAPTPPPGQATGARRRYLGLIAVGFTLLVLITSLSGDWQWGARYFMLLVPLLMALGAGAFENLLALPRSWRRTACIAGVALFALLSIAMQSIGWRHFYANRTLQEQAMRLIEASPAEVIVAGEWWMPQVFASIYYERLFLTWNPQVSGAALQEILERSGARQLVTISTTFPGAPLGSHIPLDESRWRLTSRAAVADWIVLRFYEQ